MSRWQGEMERKQAFLGRVVDIGADLWAISAVAVRARMPATTEAEDLAELFCGPGPPPVDQAFHDL